MRSAISGQALTMIDVRTVLIGAVFSCDPCGGFYILSPVPHSPRPPRRLQLENHEAPRGPGSPVRAHRHDRADSGMVGRLRADSGMSGHSG
jgi:hypothetical protein